MTADEKLFHKPGTKLCVLDNYEYPNGQIINPGDIVTIHKSKKYSGSYDFEGYPDVGWNIEDIPNGMFELFSWKNAIGGN